MPITTRDALAQGLSYAVLRGPRFNTPYRGVHILARNLDLDLGLRCDALTLRLPDEAVFSHSTAAALFGIPVGLRQPEHTLYVTVPPPLTSPRIRGVRGHVRELPRADVAVLSGRAVTSPSRVILDLAEGLPLLDVVVACDAALRQGHVSADVLVAAIHAASGRRGVVRAREAVNLSNGRAHSPMETVLRLTLHFAGLPTPEVNVDLYDDYGRWIAAPTCCTARLGSFSSTKANITVIGVNSTATSDVIASTRSSDSRSYGSRLTTSWSTRRV